MTKRIRIENADGGNARVLVEVWQIGYPEGSPDTLVDVRELHHAADQADVFIHIGRYLRVRELPGAKR